MVSFWNEGGVQITECIETSLSLSLSLLLHFLFFFASVKCLHPSPPSAVPGSVGVARNSPAGQTDWGQNEWDELKHLLMSLHLPPSLWNALSCQGKVPTGPQVWTDGLCPRSPGRRLDGGESSLPDVMSGAFKDSEERGETYYVQTFSFLVLFFCRRSYWLFLLHISD